jgi:hypothetical protein
MPISEKQLTANRANAIKSKGPITPEGKANSSKNATRHGILAKSVVLEGESTDRFAALLNSLNGEFHPETATERVCVEKMAVSHWRLLRLWAVESAGISHEINRQADTVINEDAPTRTMLAIRALSEGRHLDLMSRYEHRFDRQQYRALEALNKLQAARNARAKRPHFTEEDEENNEPAQ